MPKGSVRRDGIGNPEPRSLRRQECLASEPGQPRAAAVRYVSTGTLRDVLVGDFASSTVSTPLS